MHIVNTSISRPGFTTLYFNVDICEKMEKKIGMWTKNMNPAHMLPLLSYAKFPGHNLFDSRAQFIQPADLLGMSHSVRQFHFFPSLNGFD